MSVVEVMVAVLIIGGEKAMKHRVQRVNIHSGSHGMPTNLPWVGVLHCLMKHCGFVATPWIMCSSLVEGPSNESGHIGGLMCVAPSKTWKLPLTSAWLNQLSPVRRHQPLLDLGVKALFHVFNRSLSSIVLFSCSIPFLKRRSSDTFEMSRDILTKFPAIAPEGFGFSMGLRIYIWIISASSLHIQFDYLGHFRGF